MFSNMLFDFLIGFINEGIDFINEKSRAFYEQIAYICVINSTTSYVW